ncbi:AI-2E family transporter [Kineococcus sp. NBC_00420]|uniref:AI-2E family transporter n=1 Tax=Kineococcus sp. NBC_00420 TaxID=2903564 RepID=UPI002E244E15
MDPAQPTTPHPEGTASDINSNVNSNVNSNGTSNVTSDSSSHGVDRSAPPRLPQSVLVLLGLGGTVAAVAGMKSFSSTLGPVFLALVLVIVVHPLQAWLQRRRLPGWVGTLALLVVLYTLVLAAGAALAWAIAELASLLPTYASRFTQLEGQAMSLLARVGVDQAQVSQALDSIDTGRIVNIAQTALTEVGSGVSTLGFMLFLLFFLALDAALFPKLLAQATWKHPDAVAALMSFAAGTRRFIVVSTVFGAVVAGLDVAALAWLSVPLPLLWGLWSFLTNYIANVGFFLGLVPPALLALLANGPTNAVTVIIVFTVLNVIIQGLIQPSVVGGAVGLSTSLTFLSVVFWGFVLGAIGALLAVPLSLLARAVLVDADRSAHWLLPLIAGNPRGVRRQGARLGRTAGGGATVAPASSPVPPAQ